MKNLRLVLPVLAALVGCASATKPPVDVAQGRMPAAPVPVLADPQPAPTAPAEASQPEEPATLPLECATTSNNVCLPDAEFAKKLCNGVFPDVALSMFSKDAPWTRGYLKGDTDSWNASGGRTSRTKLAFDEEILVMSHRPVKATGIVMTGATDSYDVLRWDGTCVSLASNEFTVTRPPQPKRAPIKWERLGEATRNVLLMAPKVEAGLARLGKDCDGAGEPSAKAKCTKADAALTGVIADFVRTGGQLPIPARRP